MHTFPDRVPQVLLHRPDPLRPGHFCVVDAKGAVWAEGIPTQIAARVLAAAPDLLLGYDALLGEARTGLFARWGIRHSGPDFHELVDDEGELDKSYPGAPDHARWLAVVSQDVVPVEAESGGRRFVRDSGVGPAEVVMLHPGLQLSRSDI